METRQLLGGRTVRGGGRDWDPRDNPEDTQRMNDKTRFSPEEYSRKSLSWIRPLSASALWPPSPSPTVGLPPCLWGCPGGGADRPLPSPTRPSLRIIPSLCCSWVIRPSLLLLSQPPPPESPPRFRDPSPPPGELEGARKPLSGKGQVLLRRPLGSMGA